MGLDAAQIEMLQEQGIVVTPRGPSDSVLPSSIYENIYQKDMPVFITSDSILYAFHRLYLNYLGYLEIRHLAPMLEEILKGTRKRLALAVKRKELGPEKLELARELDRYLSVPLRLLNPSTKPLLAKRSLKWLRSTVSKVMLAKPDKLELFGQTREGFDFAPFEPQGQYASIYELQRYFRAITWLNQIPLFLQQRGPQDLELNRKNFERAATLSWLLKSSGQLKNYKTLVGILDRFVGPADDDHPGDLITFLTTQGVRKASQISEIPDSAVRAWLARPARARARIVDFVHFSQLNTPDKPVPRNFVWLGKRYLLDSEILQNLVFDRLKQPNNPQRAVLRKLPKSLDVIAALGNPRAKVHLQEEFKRYPYEHALDQERARVAKLSKGFWTQNIHSAWLAAIASLHQGKSSKHVPALFSSAPWQDKTLQTQLASWAELRHDHNLYGKTPLTGSIGCEFTGAYVEPVPQFYAKMKQLVSLLHANLDDLQSRGLGVRKEVHEQLLHFSKVLDTLHGIALKETKGISLSKQEQDFLRQAVEKEMVGCGTVRWDGWYPKLTGVHPEVVYLPTIAQVHIDPPDDANGQKLRILHAGTGGFELATILIPCQGNKQCLFFGPVSSFYEVVEGHRLTDEAWARAIYEHRAMGRPAWTQSFRRAKAAK